MLPPEAVRLAALHRARQQLLARQAAAQAARRWLQIDPGAILAGWERIAQAVLAAVTAGQAEAARGAQEYVTLGVSLTGAEPEPAGAVATRAFAGAASDGRALDTLLGYPAFEADALLAGGMDGASALAVGRRHLERIVATQIQDAARVSTGVAIVNDRRVSGYVRLANPPSCSRCAILAGKWYRYNKGFARHPHCDCVHVPSAEVIEPQSPKALFDAMTPEQRKRAGWSEADARAIEDGADIYQVTNARRDLRSVSIAGRQVQTTTSGATRYGLAGQRLGARKGAPVVRLTPEAIYGEAERLGWSRDETIRQLRRFGYIL